MTSKLKILGASTAMAAMLMTPVAAMATTAQNTDILNTVNVTYSVGGVDQTNGGASPLQATNTFKVDRKVLFSIVERTPVGTTSVVPGQTGAVTAFTLSNFSNDLLDFNMTVANLASAATTPRGTDAFDVSGLTMCRSTNGTTCDVAAAATLVIDNLVADTGTTTILVFGTIPGTATNGQISGVSLTATALQSSGAAFTTPTTAAGQDAIANGALTVETVFADDLTPVLGNVSRNGSSYAYDDYTVSTAVLQVYKSSKIISDGVSTSNFKAIPGAVVEYCIAVRNNGAVDATPVNVADDIPVNTTYLGTVGNTPKLGGTITNFATATQDCDYAGGVAAGAGYTAPNATGALGTLTPGSTKALVFRVTLN
jgi:uncharacterized repeat protein (TIGR01451 family)